MINCNQKISSTKYKILVQKDKWYEIQKTFKIFYICIITSNACIIDVKPNLKFIDILF